MVDYRIESDGSINWRSGEFVIRILSERAQQRGSGPKPSIGWGIAFKSRHDAAPFVRAGEAEGYTFEGKELLA